MTRTVISLFILHFCVSGELDNLINEISMSTKARRRAESSAWLRYAVKIRWKAVSIFSSSLFFSTPTWKNMKTRALTGVIFSRPHAWLFAFSTVSVWVCFFASRFSFDQRGDQVLFQQCDSICQNGRGAPFEAKIFAFSNYARVIRKKSRGT